MEIVLEALEITGNRAILHGGWSDFGSSGLPDHVFKVADIPHHWLFPHMAAIIHHGGAGTTAAALRAGVPSVIVPFFADQPFWARQVFRLGASPPPIPRGKLTASRLAAGVRAATGDNGIQQTAHRLGGLISHEDGVEHAANLIDGYLKNPAALMRFNP